MHNPLRISVKIAASLTLLAILTMPSLALAQNYENFDNLVLGSTPGDGSFFGNNTNPWSYTNCRGDVPISGNAITLGVGGGYSNLTCNQIAGFLRTLKFDLMQVGPNEVTVFVLVNGTQVASRTTNGQGLVVNSADINLSGGAYAYPYPVVEFITYTGSGEVTLDNISWTITPDNVETFDEMTGNSDFESGEFLGDNGYYWEYEGGKYGEIDGPAITLDEYGGSIRCDSIKRGIYSFNFNFVQRTSQAVLLKILINDEYFSTISSDAPGQLLNSGEIIVNIAGDDDDLIKLGIEVIYDEDTEQYGGEVTLDNIAWNNLAYSLTIFTGTGNWSDVTRWSRGIPTKNFHAFIDGHATVDVAAVANYLGVEPLWTLNLQGEMLTAETLTIRADETGSGSLIGSSSSLDLRTAFMIWHITSGEPEAWHLLSSPVPSMGFYNYPNAFAPSGTYPDGSGYDFYAWDEPTEMWLNRKVSANNINSFIPGKGYLAAYQTLEMDKVFSGQTFNSGTISIPVTAPSMGNKSTTGIHSGANLLGNPYPSSIDWKDRTYLDKDNLNYENDGYTMYIWNDAVNNYGAYVDNASGDAGTNGVSRYIPPLQGFFVIAQTDGEFVFNDGARVHSTQQHMKSGNEEGFRLSVQAPENAGKDEILLDFGHQSNQGGADKWYSMSDKAPSLYLPFAEKDYSIRFLSSLEDNPLIPLAFKAGLDGEYKLSANFSTAALPSIKLKDLLTGNLHDFSVNPEYTFTAITDDDANRFTLVFGALGIDKPGAENHVQVFAYNDVLYVQTSAKQFALVNVYNLTGQLIMRGKTDGNTLSTFNASALSNGVYVVNVIYNQGMVSQKVVIHK